MNSCRIPAKLQSAHLLGICGAGMQPIARALHHDGVRVSGSDPDAEKGKKLAAAGITFFPHHREENLGTPDVVVFSSAISDENPELHAARLRGIPVVHRSEMLGWFLSRRESILVAGMHGKTTTTALASLLLAAAGMDPWSFVGGSVDEFGGNLRIGGAKYAVAEADESDGSFLNLPRHHAIVTNIEPEHMNYWRTEENLYRGFREFIGAIPPGGSLVACGDDPGIRRLLSQVPGRALTYGIGNGAAEFDTTIADLGGMGSRFRVARRGRDLGEFRLGIPGRHNVANASGAIAMAISLGAEPAPLRDALAEFHGVDRRFRKRPGPAGAMLIDDYAHHPTEIAATLAAARLLAKERGGRLVAVFQPHRYTRTQTFFADFGPSLSGADHAILLDIYGAGEVPIPGISGHDLAALMRRQVSTPVEFIASFETVKNRLEEMLKVDDIVLLLGAGSVTKLCGMLSPAVA